MTSLRSLAGRQKYGTYSKEPSVCFTCTLRACSVRKQFGSTAGAFAVNWVHAVGGKREYHWLCPGLGVIEKEGSKAYAHGTG